MFTVRITYLDSVDEYGYVFKDYEFEDVNQAREFYAMKQEQYKDDGRFCFSRLLGAGASK